MALTREQYETVMQRLSERRLRALEEQKERRERIFAELPELAKIGDRLSRIAVERARVRLSGSSEKEEELKLEEKELLLKREALLRSRGLGPDALSVRWSCPHCRDTGYIGREKCGCMKKLESELLNSASGLPALLLKENFGTFRTDVFDNTSYLEELRPRLSLTQRGYIEQVILPRALQFVEDFGRGGKRNIFLYGPAGTGKTFLMNCIAKELIEAQHSAVYLTASGLFDLFYRDSSRRGDEEDQAAVLRVMDAELLVIDDLGTEFSSDFTVSRLFHVISNRLSAGTSTIISSNLSLNQISAVYGERVASRILGEYLLLPFYGRDLRLRGIGGK